MITPSTVSSLRMIDDMISRWLGPASQRGQIQTYGPVFGARAPSSPTMVEKTS